MLISPEMFILADFGLGKLKPADISSQTPWKMGQGDYLAPECMDDNFNRQEVGRAIDVWAFGCLTIEVITYMKMGVAGLKEFRKSRLSQGRIQNWKESCFHDVDGSVKPAVQECLDALTARASSAADCLVSLLEEVCFWSIRLRKVFSLTYLADGILRPTLTGASRL